jgi:outer membrane protein OmpA-like peptidoglycan-associated protein
MNVLAQNNSQTMDSAGLKAHSSVFHIAVTSRTVQAVKYEHRSGSTKLDFVGTALMPLASGEAKVDSKKGSIKIEAKFDKLQQPTSFGSEYLTYVLWAISPEGRTVNLGEVLLDDNSRSKLGVTTDLQAFALVVTAEPYYAVRQPSNVVVLENIVRSDTKGTTEAVNAKYDLLERGGYISGGYKFDPVVLNAKLPLEFFEARNALRIAQSEGADLYARDSYQHAVQLMGTVDQYASSKHIELKPLIAAARETVQTAEDSRAIAVKEIGEERLADERKASADAQTRSQLQADDAIQQKENAQSDQAKAELAKTQAQSDAANSQLDTVKAQSDLAATQASSATAIAAAQNDAAQSRLLVTQAEADKATLRAKLSEQLNSILQTRDSARGLIVSLSDVLFDTGKYSLKSGAREKLAKVAGILLSYSDLNIEVGGYTDNVGADAMNQELSENRAGSVRDYLVQQGVSKDAVTAKGFGNSAPAASNDTASGRQQNRRVELLVTGDSIGSAGNVSKASLR